MKLLPKSIGNWLSGFKFSNSGGAIAASIRDTQPQGKWSSAFAGYEPRQVDPHLYESLRESIGVLDAAIGATVVLDGIVRVQGDNDALVTEIEDFIGSVPVNDAEAGLQAFYESQGNERYEQGFGLAEWYTDGRGRDIVGIRVADSKGVAFLRTERGLETWYRPCAVSRTSTSGLDNVERLLRNTTRPIDSQTLLGYGYTRLDSTRLLYTVNSPEADGPYGTSLLRSLEFNGKTLLTIQNAIDRTWTRYGDPPLLAVYKVANRKVIDTPGELERRQKAISDKIRVAMEAKAAGNSVDLVQAIGKDDDFKIDIIGAGGVALELEMPARHLLEQIVAKTQLPPWMLGLQFSTSERMAEQQAGIALQASKTRWERRAPGLNGLIATMLRMRGRTWKRGDWVLYQELPNIQDELKQAQAEFLMAQTAMMRAGAGDVSRETAQGIDNNLRNARGRQSKGRHAHGPHHRAKAGDDEEPGEPWADEDPELPRIERTARTELIALWAALLVALRKAIGLDENSPTPWQWNPAHVVAVNQAEGLFLQQAASELGPVSTALVDVWRRAVAIAAEQVGAEAPKLQLTALIARNLRERGMAQVRTTTARVHRAEIIGLLSSGALDGLPAASVARDLARRFKAADYDWARLVSSEMVAAYGPAKLDEMRVNGVERYDWTTAGDANVCTICAGHRDAGPYVIGLGPLPMRDSHPVCRCAVVPAL